MVDWGKHAVDSLIDFTPQYRSIVNFWDCLYIIHGIISLYASHNIRYTFPIAMIQPKEKSWTIILSMNFWINQMILGNITFEKISWTRVAIWIHLVAGMQDFNIRTQLKTIAKKRSAASDCSKSYWYSILYIFPSFASCHHDYRHAEGTISIRTPLPSDRYIYPDSRGYQNVPREPAQVLTGHRQFRRSLVVRICVLSWELSLWVVCKQLLKLTLCLTGRVDPLLDHFHRYRHGDFNNDTVNIIVLFIETTLVTIINFTLDKWWKQTLAKIYLQLLLRRKQFQISEKIIAEPNFMREQLKQE
jgi:hypothetical protein